MSCNVHATHRCFSNSGCAVAHLCYDCHVCSVSVWCRVHHDMAAQSPSENICVVYARARSFYAVHSNALVMVGHRYEEFYAMKFTEQGIKHVYTVCTAGIHRSVAWAWVLMQIGMALGWTHIYPEPDHICWMTRLGVRCVDSETGVCCADHCQHGQRHEDLARWFVEEFMTHVTQYDM